MSDASPRIVLTGGPGGGKSTAAAFLAREFAERLWVLPEAATLLYQGGLPRGSSEEGVRVAQRCIFTVQRSIEHAHAVEQRGRVQLCDRGTVDGAAYWPGGPDAFFAAMGTSHERELARYDAVVFLRTAATCPGGYERDVRVRTEARDEALALDGAVLDLYRDHPQLVVIPAEEAFLGKLDRVADAVRSVLAGIGTDVEAASSRPIPARVGPVPGPDPLGVVASALRRGVSSRGEPARDAARPRPAGASAPR